MAKWRVAVLVDESEVRDYWEQGTSDPATTETDVKDFFRERLLEHATYPDEHKVEVESAQKVEGEV